MLCKEIREECFKARSVEEKLLELKALVKEKEDREGKGKSRLRKRKVYYSLDKHTKLKNYLSWCKSVELSYMYHKMRSEQLAHQAMGDIANFIAFAIGAVSLMISMLSEAQITVSVVMTVVGIIFAYMAFYYLVIMLSRNSLRSSTYLVELIEETIQEQKMLKDKIVTTAVESNV